MKGVFIMYVTKCKGYGLGSCNRCSDNGVWNRTWMCFLYKIENLSGCYCIDCVNEIAHENGEKIDFVTN